MLQGIHRSGFILYLIALCLVYLIIELFINQYFLLSVDEFWFAHVIYHYKDSLPYRDFFPYKTVLGYYLLLPLMLTNQGVMPTLLFTKGVLALINSTLFFVASYWLTRFFHRDCVLYGLLVIILSEITLLYSSQIRIDMLGYWFCLIGMLFILENRASRRMLRVLESMLAGILFGLGFITTQKSIWYIFACNCALIVGLLKQQSMRMVWAIICMNSATALVVAIYLLFWTIFSDWHTVSHSVFFEAKAMYELNWYNSYRMIYWNYIIYFNPLLILAWPLTLFTLVVSFDKDSQYNNRLFIVICASVILFCLISYKQVFTYYMQVTIPIYLMLYTSFFDWILKLFDHQNKLILLINHKILYIFTFIYCAANLYLQHIFVLPTGYILICAIPIVFCYYIYNREELKYQSTLSRIVIVSFIMVGCIYPAIALSVKSRALSGGYQKANIDLINDLLKDGSDYVAGIELIYNKTQPIAGLRHLMLPAIDYLSTPTQELRAVMLPSLYENADASKASIIKALKESSVKFYVNNYRMEKLPKEIKEYLQSEYTHYLGSIYLYAPQILEGNRSISIRFTGNYRVRLSNEDKIILNGKYYLNNQRAYFSKGTYQSSSHQSYRLILEPEKTPEYDLRYRNDNWMAMIY